MNIDFHVHGLLSKRKDFNEKFFLNEIRFAKECGINGIVLCEHFNAIKFKEVYQYLYDNYYYEGNRYIVEGVSVFPAMEVNIKNKGHVILAADREDILVVNEKLNKFMVKENLIELESLLELADIYGCLKIGAHPFRRGHKLINHSYDLLKKLDAIDLNAKDVYKKGEVMVKDEVAELSKAIGVNIVTGSDSHTPLQLGSVITKFNNDYSTIKELRNAIKYEEYKIEINKSLNFKVYSSKILKRYLMASKKYSSETDFII